VCADPAAAGVDYAADSVAEPLYSVTDYAAAGAALIVTPTFYKNKILST
jgi:hypothetical protein